MWDIQQLGHPTTMLQPQLAFVLIPEHKNITLTKAVYHNTALDITMLHIMSKSRSKPDIVKIQYKNKPCYGAC